MNGKPKAKTKAVTGKKSARVTAAGPAMNCNGNPAATSSNSGIRSVPRRMPWNPATALNQARNRDRVLIARALDEILPFMAYAHRVIPEEAISDGLVISSASQNKDFARAATKLFDEWGSSTKIDVANQLNIYTCQSPLGHLFCRDGSAFAIKVKSEKEEDLVRPFGDKTFRAIQLQFLRRDQLGTSSFWTGKGAFKKFDDGIELDGVNRPINYRILQAPIGEPMSHIDYAVSRVIHIKEPDFEGIHGQPWFFRGGDSAVDAIDLRALQKHSDKIKAAFLGVITTGTGAPPRAMQAQTKPGKKTDPADATRTIDDNSVRHYAIADGVHIPVLRKDESISFFTNQSQLSFGEQLVMLYKEICFSGMIPPEYLWQFADLGSGAVRLLLRKMSKVFSRFRRPFINVFLQQVWEMVISECMTPHWVGKKRYEPLLPMVDDWASIHVRPAPDPSIDAGRDEKGDQNSILNLTKTRSEYGDERNKDGLAVALSCLDELGAMIAHGKKLGLPWFLSIPKDLLQAASGVMSMDYDFAAIAEKLKLNQIETAD
jgi:hypothetical protein